MKGLWRNNKTGKAYFVTGCRYDATNSRDGQTLVDYADTAGHYGRELSEFLMKFTSMESLDGALLEKGNAALRAVVSELAAALRVHTRAYPWLQGASNAAYALARADTVLSCTEPLNEEPLSACRCVACSKYILSIFSGSRTCIHGLAAMRKCVDNNYCNFVAKPPKEEGGL